MVIDCFYARLDLLLCLLWCLFPLAHRAILKHPENIQITRHIHPVIFFRSSEVRPLWQQAYQGVPGRLLSSSAFQLLLGDSKVFPSQPDTSSLHRVLGPRAGTALRGSDLEATAQVPKPPQSAPFNGKEQWLYSELPREFLTLTLQPSPATLQRNLI